MHAGKNWRAWRTAWEIKREELLTTDEHRLRELRILTTEYTEYTEKDFRIKIALRHEDILNLCHI